MNRVRRCRYAICSVWKEGEPVLLKLIGSMCLLFAGTLYGFFEAMQYARRPKQIRQLVGVLQRLETEISYGLTPLPEALMTTSRQVEGPLAVLLRTAAERLESRDGSTTREIWDFAVKGAWGQTAMKSAEKEILLQLGFSLGVSDRDDQVKHLRLAISHLQVEEAAALDEQRKYERMWRSLGVLCGALAVILMY